MRESRLYEALVDSWHDLEEICELPFQNWCLQYSNIIEDARIMPLVFRVFFL